jgi:hypothetical protein
MVVLLATGLGACSKQDQESSSADVASEPQHLWKDQQKALQRAGQVEQDMMDAYKRRDKEMEKQEQ